MRKTFGQQLEEQRQNDHVKLSCLWTAKEIGLKKPSNVLAAAKLFYKFVKEK
jgi:hypothetical protein